MGLKSKQSSTSYRKNDKINRNFSTAFKQKKVDQIMKGQLSVTECSRLYGVSQTAIYRWLSKHSSSYTKDTKMVVQLDSEEFKAKALANKLAELERVIGQKQLEIDYLTRIVEMTSEDVGYDVKKKHAPELSSGLKEIQ